jgi:raffinose/stachyose/melibiose transport system substrate-binding protein
MGITRRQLLAGGLGAGGVGMLGALAGCSSPQASASDPITIWSNLEDAGQVAYFREHFARAYRKHPVQFSSKPSNTIDRLIQTSLAAGGGPSVIVTPGPSSFVSAYDSAGYLVDLSDAAEQYGWEGTFAGWALEASRIKDRLMTLPTSYESMAFYSNPATLDELGLEPPRSLEDFEAFCTEAAGKGRIPLAAGNADYKGANEWHVGVGLNHGAGPEAVHAALTGKAAWTDPVFVDAIEQLSRWFKAGWFGGAVDRYFTNSFPTVYRQLASGEAAGMISGTWEFASLGEYFGEEAGNDAAWEWTTVPSLSGQVQEVVWDLAIGQSAGVNTNAGNIPATVEYLNFLTTDVESIVAGIEEMAFAPPPVEIDRSDFADTADPRIVDLYDQLSAARSIGYTTWTFFPQQTETYMINYFENVITGRMSAREYCEGINDRFTAERAQGRVPTAPKPGGGLS